MAPSEIKKIFQEKFGREPIIVRAPGRINFIGEHTDYNNGWVLPAAINKEVYIAIASNNLNEFRVLSLNLNDYQSFGLNELKPGNKWINYLQGVMSGIHKIGFPLHGVDVLVSGNIPVGAGLSSSAALCCGFGMAYSKTFDIELSKLAIAKIAQYAEHEFAGVKCGLMDQYASLFGEKNHAVLLDCESLTHELIPFNFSDVDILLIDTKVKHTLAETAYNNRREACELGIALIMRKYDVKSLRDVTLDILNDLKADFPDDVFRRCSFVVQEIDRTKKAAEFLKKHNIQAFGNLLYQTHEGLSKDYEVSCEEADFLVSIAKNNNKVFGARMMGGGFGGCTINLIRKEETENFKKVTHEKYIVSYQKEPDFYSITLEQGVSIIQT